MSTLTTGVNSSRACHTRIRAFSTRAGRIGGLLLAIFLAALPLQAVAQTQGVSISVSPNPGGQYPSIDEGGTFEVTLRRTGDKSNALTVQYATRDGGGPQVNVGYATAGTDYTAVSGLHTFPPMSSESFEFSVETTDEATHYEPREYFTITVSGSYLDQGETASFTQERELRINEDDERYLTLSPVSNSALGSSILEFMAKEGGAANENQLTISLNDKLPYILNIPYTVGFSRHTTAATSDDFKMEGGTVTIPIGQTSVNIDIGIVDDKLFEPTEYFTLQLLSPGYTNFGNGLPTYRVPSYQDSRLSSQPLSVSITDNDIEDMGGFVYLSGEGPSGPGVINDFPSTRRTITEGQSVTITAEIAGVAPSSDIQIPLKVIGFPSDEVTSADYSIDEFITIKATETSGNVTLTVKNDSMDERYRELLVVEIDDTKNFPTGYTKGDRSKYEVIMLDNDKTPANLTGPTLTALTEDRNGTTMATFQLSIDRRPKADPTGDPPFTGADTKEVDAKLVLGYTGKATRGTDYKLTPNNLSSNNGIVIRKSPAQPPSGCSLKGEAVTCTVTLTVQDDNLYEGGSGTTESVKIDLDTGESSFTGGIAKPNSLNLTIEDDELQPMFSIADVSGPEDGNLTFTIEREGARGNNVSVTAGTGSHSGATNSATADTDYTTKSQKLDFGRGNTTQTFEVAITDDNIDEPDEETFAVTLSNPVDNQGLPKPAIKSDGKTAVGTITDNDDAPTQLTISVDTDAGTDDNQTSIDEAAGQTTVHVTATITSPTRFATDQTVTVTVGNPDNAGEASEGEGGDYETVDQFTITISATEASGKGTFELKPLNDRIDDDGEKISVEGELGDMMVTHAAITIEDDDTRGITVSKTTLTIDEVDDTSTEAKENEDTYEVVLKSEPTGTVTVDITNPGPTVATADPSSLTFTAANWETAQTVTVIAKDDTIDDAGDQKTTTITHTVSAAGTDYVGEDVGDVEITVRDDDEAPMALTITLDTDTDTADNQSTIREGADKPTVRITATLDGDTQFATDQTITITVGDSDKDTATEGSGGDYNTVAEFNITLPAGDESVSHDLTLNLNNDTVDEADEETVTVTGELADVTVKGTTFTIEDDDDTPTVTLVLTPASINESGSTNASTVKATMDGKSSEAVTLTVAAMPVSPAVVGDLTVSDNKTLTIPANTQASTGVVTITAVDNKVDAANKTITVAATATGGNALVQAPENQTLTITDDDTRGITVSKATLTLDEEDNAATMEADEDEDTYTVVLDSEPSDGTVTIGVASGDTTIAGVAPATLTFTASNWDEPQTVTVTAVLDGIDNPSDRRTAAITHTVTATGTDYDGATASGVTVTVNDDDGPPTLSINSPSVTEVDKGATATLTFTVRLQPASGNTVTVGYVDAGAGTATSGGTDYATLAGGTLTFAPTETSKPVAVTVSGDDIDEADETVVVRLSSPSKARLTGGATTLDGTGTINDNDPMPTVSVADATAVSEGNVASPNPTNNITFAVTLSAISGLDVTVPYTLSGTATAGTDYTEPDPRSVTIAAGTTQANIDIPVAGDEVDEENETITVTLGTPTNATVSTVEGAGAATGTITDDDTRGVSVTPTALTVAEADDTNTAAIREDQETYEVVLTSQPTGAVTVNLKSGDESVARINTASLVFDADDWNSERTVTVTGQPDVIDNTDDIREVDISHTVSAAGTDYADETAESVAVTVTDDDAPPSGITLTASPDSVTENGGAKTITVTAAVNGATRYAEARTVSVSVGGGIAISGTDYTTVESFDITIGAGEDDASNTFTLTPENDVLAEGSETIDVTGTLSGITITPDEITLTDDDAAPSGITLSVDTNGAEDGTPSTVAEDAGATVVTVTATVNGTTRYVDAKTVAVSVDDDTAASPADYAAVSGFNITIAAGAASHTGSFTVTPVDDDLDESNETIDVTGTLSSVTITGATVTFTDNDDPVSFSIADAEATEGGKVTFTVSRKGAGDNVASVKIATATDSGDGIEAADADDYTAIATAQTVNFAKGVATQTVEVQTTQDDLFEPDETFLVNLSAPALADGDPGTGVSIESGKGTATGTITNDDTEPSFAVADASASEGDAITFTVTRSGAMDNAVSVKWNTKADSSDGANAALATDYTPVAAATTLTFAKGVGSQTFTVATTEDNLDEDDETFLVELTEPAGGTIATEQATGTINDDDAAPSGITLSVDTNGSTSGTPSTVAEDAGATVVTVTATVNGTTRYVDAKTVAVSVDDDTAASPADYAAVSGFNITIAAGAASHTGSFTVTPVDDDLDESNETIDVTGTLSSVTITGATVTFTDNDDPVSFSIADAEATEGGKVTFTVSRKGAGDNVASVKIATATDSGDGIEAADADDYTAIATAQTVNFAKGVATQTVEVQTTQDDLFEPDETFLVNLSAPALADGDPGTGVSIESGKGTATGTITNDDTEPSFAVADASASEGDAITFTVTRSGAMDNAVSVKWNTKADSSDGANAALATDYTPVAAATTLTFAKGVGSQTFTVATTEDVLDEGDETFLVELTGAVGGTIATAQATGTINDDDDAPSGITLSVDTNGSTSGTPSTVAEDAGATVVTVTATVNGTTRYVDAKTVAVSVDDDTAASPADYAAVSGFNITIAAGAASHTGSFTVTPVDDDLDESNETIDVTGTLSSVTITGATVTFTDNDDPVSFSIADAEATEGGKVVFTVSRKGAGDNVASVKIATAADSGDGVNAASTSDYTAIATAQTLNFAKGVTSQTVEVQTTQDDLFEPDETFKAVLSAPALADGDPGTGVSIESGKGTATGTITNDDTEPSFAVADASASEGDAITFTVTRSGAMDNAVSVKWNTKAATGAGAALATDYTPVAAATTLTFAKGVGSQTFTVATTEDVLDEGDETFLVELTGAVGGTIATAQATGTINDDDDAPSGITLSVDTNGSTSGTPSTVAEDAGATVVTVTATVNGTTRYVDAKTVAVSVDDDTAASPADYAAVSGFNITIAAGAASHTGSFTVTPVDDDLDESNETIDVTGTLSSVTITGATVTFTDNDDPVSFSIADAEATEGGKVVFTVSRKGAGDNVASVKIATAADSGDGVNAASTSDYTAIATAQTLNFAKGVTSQTVEVQTTQDDLFEPDETFKAVLSAPALADGDPGTGVSIESGKGTATGTITNDDTEPSFAVADASASEGDAITFTVTRSGAMDNAVSVKWNTKADSSDGANAALATDYTPVAAATTLTFAKGVGSQTFTVATTEDNLDEDDETFLVELTEPAGGTIATAEATGTINDDDAAPTGITLTVSPATVGEGAGETEITVTATVNGTTRYVDAKTVTVSVGGGTAISDTDYDAVANFDITIAAGDASKTGTFDLTPKQDDLHEGSETINVSGTSDSLTITPATVTINDDDGQPSFAVADASANEGDAITFTVTRSGAMDNAVSVKWNTKAATDAGAASTSDYTVMTTATKLDFAKGVSRQTFTVATTEDVLHEGNETFLVELTEPVSAIISDAEATGTINDDDAEPTGITLTVSPATVGERAGETEITVTATVNGTTRYVDAKTVTVSVGGGTAISGTDYDTVTNFDITIAAGEASKVGTFDLTPKQDDLHEGSETINVSGTSDSLTITPATVTINDDDAAPSGITLSVDTNGSTAGTPNTVAEGAGATVVTVTATVNGTTRYVDAKTVAVSVADNTAASPADYAAVNGFNITIAAGAASHTGSFTVTPVDDDLDESNETIDVTGTLSSVTVTAATVTLTDNDDPVSFSIADAEATEGGKVVFTVSRAGAEDNVVSVKIATAADSGDGVNAASTSDYTAIATAQTLNFAKDITSQTVEVQTTQDDLFEPDETFKAVLSEPALGDGDPGTGVTIESGKGTAIGTIKNDDTKPSFAVADASASEGDSITFTVTRSGAMDNAVSVKWNTKADSSDGANAALATDYTPVAAATTLTFAKGVGSQTFTVATTEDNLDEDDETFLVELTEPAGGTIATAEATGTINDDDAAPSGITLTVSPATVGEGAGETEITVTATVNGTTRYVDAKTVTVSVGGGTAISDTDYDAVANFDITIAAGDASKTGTFDLTPKQDDLHEGSETINVSGTSDSLTITPATVTINDDDGQPSFAVADASANEGDAITFTVTRSGAMDNAVSVKWNTKAATDAGAASTSDYTVMTTATKLDFAKGVSRQTFTVATTEDVLHEGNETFLVELTEPVSAIISDAEATGTINDDDAAPTALTLSVDADTGTNNVQTSLAEDGGEKTVRVTATLGGSSTFTEAKTVVVEVGADADGATEGMDYANVETKNITINAGASSGYVEFTLTPTDDDIDEPDEGISIEGTLASVTVTGTSLTITDDEGTPTVTLVLTPSTINESGDTNSSTVTATLSGKSSVAVTLTVAAAAGADTASGDFTVTANKTLTIAEGATTSTGAVTITAVDNDVDAPNKTVTVSATASGGGVANPGNQTLTITDDEGIPTATLVLTPTMIDESGATNASTVTATLSGKSNTAVTLTVAAAAGADTASGDFTVTANKTLTIAAGTTTSTGAVTITAVDNDIDAPNKTVTVSATASGGGVANPGNQTLTITDDEGTPTVTLVLTPSTINESGNGNASTVTATLSGKSNTAVTLTVAATAGADTAASDFTVSNNKILTIAAGATTSNGAVTITAVDNDIDAPNKTVTVSATASGGGVANPGNQTLTITDDEGTPTVTLVLTPSTINESGNGNASTVTATLSGKSNEAVILTVATTAGADTTADDFTVSANKTLTIAAGATTSNGAVTITAVDNDIDAPNKTVTVSATASGGGVANPGNQTLTITDDEGIPTATLVLTPSTINESGGTNSSTVTATLSGKSNTSVTLTVAAASGADTTADDFTVSNNKTLTIAAGATTSNGAVTITAVDNDIDAPNKTVTVSATASGGGVANPTNQTLTINDDEGLPTATLVLTPTMINESGNGNASTVTATLSGKSNTAVTLTVAAAAGANTAAGDFTLSPNKTLTIAAGATTSTGAVTITAVDNNVDAPNKMVTVSATASGGGVADPTNQTLTIKDDDDVPSSITLSVSPATVGEAGGAKMVRVTVTLVGSTFTEAKTVTLDVGADADSAEKGTDYTTVEQQSIKINAGAASGYVEFKLTPLDDTLHEGSETISLEGTLADETLADVTVTDATITLTDDDATPSGITLSVSPATVGEGAGETEITVTASVNGTTRYTNAKTVTVSVGGGSATSGTDYKAVSNFDITIPAGEASKAGTFDLTPTQDDLHEGNETINLDGTLTSVTVTGTMITLTDDDGQPSFSVADASADEGDAITFTVTRSGAMDNAVSVKWNTKADTGGGAASTSDYTAMTTATKLDFASGVSSQTFTVATTEDNLHEGNETFLVELTEPVGAIISDSEATGTINDDDAVPTALTLTVDTDMGTNNVQTSLAEDDGAKMVRVTATLGDSSTFNVAQTVTVEVGADTDSAIEGMDYTNVGTQNITINAGESSGYVEFPLTPTDDDIDEPNEGISVEGTLTSVTVTGTSLTITDDEGTPTVTLVLTPTTINENGATNTSTVTATLSGESSAAVTVEVSVPNTAPVTLSSNTTLTIAAGAKASTGTVAITAVDNNVDAPNKTVTVSATASGGEVANPVNQTLTINDDDVAPTGITLSVSPNTVGEEDGETEITVTATVKGSTRYADAKTVTVSVGGGTAISGTDYHAVSNFDIIIAAAGASKTGTFNLTPIKDALQEEDETVEVSGSSGALDITKATITITNSGSLPAAWLGRFGRAVAEQTLDGIAGRIAASRNPGVQGSIAGHGLNFDSPSSGSETLPRFDPRAGAGGTGLSSTTNNTTTLSNLVNNDTLERSELTLMSGYGGTDVFDSDGTTSQSHTMTARELLLGSSFTATGEKDVSGGSLASWGRTAQSSFDGREGTLLLDGETTTTMLGVDYARDHWLVGMALMRSNGKGGYRDSETKLRAASPACSITENGTEQDTCNSAVRNGEGDGEIEATLTAVVPYAAIQTSEQLKLWGTLGHGTGEVTLMSVVGDPLKANISWTMAAVGLRSDIIVPQKNSTELGPLSGSGLALAFTADALWARTDSDRTDDLLASNSDVTRLRFGLEGSYPIALQKGGSITPRLEMSVRHDGGTAETGLGLELVGGLTWLDPTLGLSIDLSGRTLIIHSSDDLKNQSFAVEFAWDPDPATRRGPALTFSQQWGTKALGGLDTPFGPDSIEDIGDSGNTAGWLAEASWGFPIFGGSFTGSPHVGVGLASGTRDYTLGWRLTPAANANAPDLSFKVNTTRQESDNAPPKHSIGFELKFRW